MATNWHIITGGPGTGKTVLINMLQKLGYDTVPEAARQLIDEGLDQGKTLQDIRGDEYAWQVRILNRILDNESTVKPTHLTFFDRGPQDNLAHLKYYGLTPQAEWNDIKSKNPYKTVFLLEPLGEVAEDYYRIEDIEFTRTITGMMEKAYKAAGAAPIRIPAMPPIDRLRLILSHIGLPLPDTTSVIIER